MNFSRDPHPSVDRKSHHKGNIGCVARDKEQSKDNSPFTRTIYLCTNARTRRPFSLHPNPKIPFNLVALMCLQKECFQSGISSFDSPSENWNSIRKQGKIAKLVMNVDIEIIVVYSLCDRIYPMKGLFFCDSYRSIRWIASMRYIMENYKDRWSIFGGISETKLIRRIYRMWYRSW